MLARRPGGEARIRMAKWKARARRSNGAKNFYYSDWMTTEGQRASKHLVAWAWAMRRAKARRT